MKPPVPYFGSKARIAPWIASLLPDHEHYVEPYCGGLSVLLAKTPSKLETANDLDGQLVTFWRILRDQPDDLARACTLTPHSRAEHTQAYEPADSDLETARRVWVRLTQGRSGRMDRTGWRHCIADIGTNMPAYLDGYRTRLHPVAERLMSVQLECRPALEVIAAFGARPGVLLYLDPPYLGSTRSRTASGYRHELRGEAGHRELAGALADCKAAVVLSGYHSPLYDGLYEGWHRYERPASAGNAAVDRGRVEVLWANRPLGADGLGLVADLSA
ncbi:DNA adenine methylase [Streptomyces phaeochromogenes]|uniref:DNA adenine methylase n=1 Tax=Streptomyces phaeochromogenes TaxID=1923 RepID=UPI0022560757|nr:DNA adenine methylase [Streptomyces phaeochromogenes]MCX5598380.1 DNA adenine methylase [Streptomyces phaeochromogenes]